MSGNQFARRYGRAFLMLSTAVAALTIHGASMAAPLPVVIYGPQGGTGADGPNGAGDAGGGPGMNGLAGTGPGAGAGGAAGGNATFGATGTNGGNGGILATGGAGGGGGPSIFGTGTTAILNNPVGTTLRGSDGQAGAAAVVRAAMASS